MVNTDVFTSHNRDPPRPDILVATPVLSIGTHPLPHQSLTNVSPFRCPIVLEVAAPRYPRALIASLRQNPPLHRSLDVGAVQIQKAHLFHPCLLRFVHLGHHARHAFVSSVLDDSHIQPCSRVCSQCPGRVGVAEDEGEVGNVLQHCAFPDEFVGDRDGRVVDAQFGVAAKLDFQAGGGDDDVGVQVSAVAEFDACFCDGVDLTGDHVAFPRSQGFEEVSARRDAHSLLPGKIGRDEIGVHLQVWGEFFLGGVLQHFAEEVGEQTAEVEEDGAEEDHAPSDQLVRPVGGQPFLEEDVDVFDDWRSEEIAGRALEHGD